MRINTSLPIMCYQMYAYPLSIILTKKEAYNWYVSNFINYKMLLHANYDGTLIMDLKYIMPRYDDCRDFCEWTISHQVFVDCMIDQLLYFIKRYIDQNVCVSFFVDEFYIPDRIRYQKQHNVHQLLVTGYYTGDNTIKIVGYNRNRKFDFSIIPLTALKQGIIECNIIHLLSDDVHMYRMREPCGTYEIDLAQIKKEFYEYLHSENTYCPEVALKYKDYNFTFGLACYDHISALMRDANCVSQNYPMFYMIYEHKKSIGQRLCYLQEQLGIDFESEIGTYSTLTTETHRLMKLFSKRMFYAMNSSHIKTVSNQMADIMERITDMEGEAVTRLLEKINA